MPDLMINRGTGSTTSGSVSQGRWLDQQQYLIETYRQIRDNLGEMEAEIEAARLRVTDWSRHRREQSRSRSLSHASISTNMSSHRSCSTYGSSCTDDASCLHVHTDEGVAGSSCPSSSSCSSTCGITLPAAVAASLNAATLISAFLAASSSASCTITHASNQPSSDASSFESGGAVRPHGLKTAAARRRSRTNRSASPM